MTARAGAVQALNQPSSAGLGGKGSPNVGGLSSNSPPPPATTSIKYKMVGRNNLGAAVSWIAPDAADLTASLWVGGNTPISSVFVSRKIVRNL